MKRLLVITGILIFFLIGSNSFAYTDNCALVKDYNPYGDLAWNFKTAYENLSWKELLPKNWLKKAIENLKKYCCNWSEKEWSCSFENGEQEKLKTNNDYPRSPYLYDHLVNVMLRRLSPYPYEDVEKDEKSEEWQTFISWFANNATWGIPQDLLTKYNEYWKRSDNRISWFPRYRLSLYNWVSNTAYQIVMEGVLKDNKVDTKSNMFKDTDKFEKIADWDLTTKHLNVCQIATNYSRAFWNFDSSDLTLAEAYCINRVYDILVSYSELYSKYIKIQWNILAQRALENYNNYFNSRTQSINTSVTRSNTYLFWVVKGVWQITSICN